MWEVGRNKKWYRKRKRWRTGQVGRMGPRICEAWGGFLNYSLYVGTKTGMEVVRCLTPFHLALESIRLPVGDIWTFTRGCVICKS